MAKLTKVFNTKTALDVLYIGGGAVAGTVVGSKAYAAIKDKVDAEGKLEPYIKGGIPIVAGVLFPSLVKGPIGSKLGQGMIAAGGSIIVKELLEKAGVPTNGVGNVMMGNVMMQGSDYMSPARDMGNGTALGNTEGTDSYTPSSYDFTSADAGEMDF